MCYSIIINQWLGDRDLNTRRKESSLNNIIQVKTKNDGIKSGGCFAGFGRSKY